MRHLTECISFRTTIELGGKTATGLPVSNEVVAALGAGKRPVVRVRVGSHTYRTTIASMGGRFLIPPQRGEPCRRRNSSRRRSGRTHRSRQRHPRRYPAEDLAEALNRDQQARDFYDTFDCSHRKEWVRWIEDAKKPEPARAASTRHSMLSARANALADLSPPRHPYRGMASDDQQPLTSTSTPLGATEAHSTSNR